MRRVDKVFNKVKRLKVQSGDILVFNVDSASFSPDKFHAKIKTTLDDITAKLVEMGTASRFSCWGRIRPSTWSARPT